MKALLFDILIKIAYILSFCMFIVLSLIIRWLCCDTDRNNCWLSTGFEMVNVTNLWIELLLKAVIETVDHQFEPFVPRPRLRQWYYPMAHASLGGPYMWLSNLHKPDYLMRLA